MSETFSLTSVLTHFNFKNHLYPRKINNFGDIEERVINKAGADISDATEGS